MRTGEDAIAWGRNQITNPSQDWTRMCLKFVRSCYGIPAKYADAGKAWDNAKMRHRNADPFAAPRGAPVFFETPGTADHIVLGLGKGLCLTNDWSAPGKISVARIADIATHWRAPLLGWSEDLNGVVVFKPPAPPAKPLPPKESPMLTHIRNQWNDFRRVEMTDLDALIKAGHQPDAQAAKDTRNAITAAMRQFFEEVD